jgi:chromate transporter
MLRRSTAAGAFLDGVNAASLGLMATVAWQLGRAALVDIPTVVIAMAALAALLRGQSSAWLVAAGGLAGWLKIQLL